MISYVAEKKINQAEQHLAGPQKQDMSINWVI